MAATREAGPGFPGRSDGQITKHFARNEWRHFTSAFVCEAKHSTGSDTFSHLLVNQVGEPI